MLRLCSASTLSLSNGLAKPGTHPQGGESKRSADKLWTHPEGGESKRSADKSLLGGEMMP